MIKSRRHWGKLTIVTGEEFKEFLSRYDAEQLKREEITEHINIYNARMITMASVSFDDDTGEVVYRINKSEFV